MHYTAIDSRLHFAKVGHLLKKNHHVLSLLLVFHKEWTIQPQVVKSQSQNI